MGNEYRYRVFRRDFLNSKPVLVFSTYDKASAAHFVDVANIAFKAKGSQARCYAW
jgi:hypothetical protein